MRIVGNPPSGGKKPTTPVIGTATDGGTGTSVSVAFTPSTYIGKGTITYTATSSPGSLTGTGSGSPITVSGLTTGTAYTFTVAGTTNYGVASDSSAASNSVTPASPSSFESIATVNAGGSTTIAFNSIPQTFKHLQLRYNIKCGFTGSADFDELSMRVNGATSGYAYHRLRGSSSGTVTADGYTSQGNLWAGWIPNDNSSLNNMFASGIIDIHDYASTTKNKTIRITSGFDTNGNLTSYMFLASGLYPSTTAITSLSFFDNFSHSFASGSTIALYGVKG